MAVPEQTPYIEHTGNGSSKSFSLGFQCESKDHLIVLVDEIEPPIATWSLTGGNVVFTTAPAAGKKITIQRNTPFSRTTDYQSYNNSFRPPAVNKDFDWIWLKLQELGVADWILGARIDALKNYVDDRDDELRAYLMEEIRKQGVALDQLDEYYNYLMQRLAQIAVDKGWDASFVVDGNQTQKEINLYGGKKYDMPVGGYPLNAVVVLNNGDPVHSTISGNKNDPNTNPIGWYSPKQSQSAFVSIFDFMTMAQFRDWKASQETYNLTSVLQAAINTPDIYEVFLPQGTYLHSGLYCDKNNFRFYSSNYARSVLKSDSTAAPALHIAKNVTGISGFFLDGIKLQGSPEATRAIQLGDATKYVQFCNLNNCMIDGFTKSDACDIYLGSVQELDIVNTMSWRGNIGIYKAQGGYGTSVKISGKAGYLGRHAKYGIKLDGQIDDIYVQDNVIEGNGLEAIYISNTAFKNTQGVTIYLQNAYFEANAQTGIGAGVIYAKGSSTYLKKHKVYIDNCNFADNPNAPAGFKDVAGEWLSLSISGTSNILPGDVDVTNSEITFTNNQSVSSGDIFASLKALRDKIGNKLFATGFDYVNGKQANFMSSITFPTTANLSTDANTIDDYREVEFTPTVTGNGGTVSAAVGKYTKIGNLVNFTIQLATQNFTSTQGSTKISLPHTQIIGAVAQFINNQSYSGGVALTASQAVNLPTLAAQGASATIYITGQYMTAQ
ncbi:MAG: hypothetical protein ACK4KU_00520 [Acinetobacter sp.]|uniref:hypothetical protein n=1 Tax=Acinetobacter sp. TaxID=472 RepID=UPI00391CB255